MMAMPPELESVGRLPACRRFFRPPRPYPMIIAPL